MWRSDLRVLCFLFQKTVASIPAVGLDFYLRDKVLGTLGGSGKQQSRACAMLVLVKDPYTTGNDVPTYNSKMTHSYMGSKTKYNF